MKFKPYCRHHEGIKHHCGYVNAVDRLVDEAWQTAVSKAREYPNAPFRITVERYYHEEMERLCVERGLRQPSPPHFDRRQSFKVH